MIGLQHILRSLPLQATHPFARGAVILTITSGISYALGLIRDRTLAGAFGASDALDAYQAAFVIPDALFNLFVAGALTTAFLPVYTDLITRKQRHQAARLAGTLLFGGLGLLGAVAALAFLFAPYLVSFVAPGFAPAKLTLLASLTRLMLLSPLLFLVSNLLGSMLVSRQRFLWYGLSPVLYNLGIILGIIILAPTFGIYGAVAGTITGAALHLAARLVDLHRARLRIIPTVQLTAPVKKVVKLMLPRALGLSAVQVQLWIFVAIASTLGEGAVTVYSLARNFQSFPVSLIGIAFATSLFPLLAESASKGDQAEYFRRIIGGALATLVLVTPAALALYLLRVPIISLLVGTGQFNTEAILRTATVLGVYTLSIPTESLVHILARGFYAVHNTLIPVAVSLLAITFSTTWAALAAPTVGMVSIPAGFAAGTALQALLLAILLRRYAIRTMSRMAQ
jgi:putative peptidoglycan lipid II flippase